MKVKGKIVPLRDNILVTNMNFDFEKTESGIILTSDNGKTQGIHPRWAQVWAIGPDQEDVKVGNWVCVEHGRWTRTIEFEIDNETIELRMVDKNSILLISDNKPNDVMRSIA